MNTELFVKFLAAELKQNVSTVESALNKFYESQPLSFSSKKAEEAYDEAVAGKTLKKNIVVGTGPSGKVTMDDIRKATGVVAKGAKVPSEWVSTAAKELADEHGFIDTDFNEDDRSGKPTKAPLASGLEHRISIEDVRKRILIKAQDAGEDVTELKRKFYSSPGVADLAEKNDLSPTDFDVKGEKITKSMVDAKIKQLAVAGEDENNNPFDGEDEQDEDEE